VKFMVAFWKDAHDEGGLAWDDSNNNRAFLSGTRLGKNYQHFSKFDVRFGYDESYIQDGREPRPD
jgi:hypothetical protein